VGQEPDFIRGGLGEGRNARHCSILAHDLRLDFVRQ
jgi:hypothetical protein